MRDSLFLFTILLLLATRSVAQTYIEPVTGYQVDIANKEGFMHINTGLQLSFKRSKSYELIVRVQKSWPLIYHDRADSAFTTNSSLPLYTSAGKTICPVSWYFSLDHRFIFNGSNAKQHFSMLLHTGLNFQNIIVNYTYDKNNYAVLNPKKTLETMSFYLGTGFEYMRLFKSSRLFFQITVDSPPAKRRQSYPYSFSFMAPLAFNAGYSILIKTKKHEK